MLPIQHPLAPSRAHTLDAAAALRIAEIRLDGVHLGQAERPEPFLTQVHKRLIVPFEGNGAHLRCFVRTSHRGWQKGLRTVLPVSCSGDTPLLNEGIRQDIADDPFDILPLQGTPQEVQG